MESKVNICSIFYSNIKMKKITLTFALIKNEYDIYCSLLRLRPNSGSWIRTVIFLLD